MIYRAFLLALCGLVACFSPTASTAQDQWWHHERLQSGVYVASGLPCVHINSRGGVCYNAAFSLDGYFDAYRNRENVSGCLGPDRSTWTRGINEHWQVLYSAIKGDGPPVDGFGRVLY